LRFSVFHTLTLAAFIGLIPLLGFAQEAGITARFHPWGLFDPGTWKTVRVVTETLNEQGQVVSICTTDTKTTLVDIDNQGVTLEIQTCMEVAGKRFEAEPQTLKQGFHGELVGPNLKIKEPVEGQVEIEGRKIACMLEQLEAVASTGKTVTTIYYSATVAPYILKRESTTTDAEGANVLSETNVDVITFALPLKIQGNSKSGIQMKTVHKNTKGTVTTLASVLPEVPGGVVSSSSKELDKAGQLVRRSTLALIDYSDDPEKDWSGMFGRKRPPRHRPKPPPRHVP
jgi:hypothetical protein